MDCHMPKKKVPATNFAEQRALPPRPEHPFPAAPAPRPAGARQRRPRPYRAAHIPQILVLLVIDAVRESQKYDDVTEKVNLQNNPGAVEHFHMKLFRAQRNLYIAGFSLLLSFLLRRLVTLISQQATLLASNEGFKKQAESASEAAKKYMEENDQLKKEAAAGGVKCFSNVKTICVYSRPDFRHSDDDPHPTLTNV
uniref:B-cell receptor-associated protein 31-like n=1 Tax=Nyctereutes procyonoides TaxID=34880 RepID=UPI0024445E15|nr:B-cell receptor-associated protein 31-like [Nyctereutes procyonoides]